MKKYEGRITHKDVGNAADLINSLTGLSLAQDEFDALVEHIIKVGIPAFKKSKAAERLVLHDTLGLVDELEAERSSAATRAASRMRKRMETSRKSIG